MEKFKTFNNALCKEIVRQSAIGNNRAVYMLLYNSADMMTDDLFVRVYNFVFEIAPLTLDVFNTLPNNVQSYFNSLWLSK